MANLKILFAADIHLNGGFETEEAQNLLRIANYAVENKIKIIVIGGDIYESKSTAEQRLVFKEFVDILTSRNDLTISDNTEIIILRGNHDEKDDLKIFSSPWVYVAEKPEFFELYGLSGKQLQIHCLPHFNAGAVALQMQDQAELGEIGTNLFDKIIDDIFQKVHNHNGPSMVVFHGVISGASLDNGYIPRQNGIVLNGPKLSAIGCPVVGGHYHTHQEVYPNVWYPGSITRQTFGEAEGPKGFMVFEYGEPNQTTDPNVASCDMLYPDQWMTPQFIELPQASMILIEGEWHDRYMEWYDAGTKGLMLQGLVEHYRGAKVRFRYRVKQEDIATIDLSGLEPIFSQAKEVKWEPIIEFSTAIRSVEMQEAESIPECLEAYMKAKAMDEKIPTVLLLYRELEQENTYV